MEFSLTLVIVIITCIVSISAFNNHKIMSDLIFYGPAISQRNQWYRMITHGLIHADIPHLFFNMFALYSFGTAVEKVFSANCLFGNLGKLMFLILYVTALAAASIPDLMKYKDSYHFQSLGASGAVSAVIFASIVVMPKVGVGIIFIPGVRIPGYIFGILYLIISAYLDKRGDSNINHGAHLWGAIYGLLFTVALIYAMGQLDLIENFKQQLAADEPFIPAYCR
ncbi:MAG TPA: rhomboid family intramembrane serine protease [Chitinophagaceae bacterium]|nr:rhomboid family intramembrane serine protease [Chitinophagaceae bacterium]